MILNKLQSLSLPRLLHVALSLLCVFALVLVLASGALALSGDSSGYFSDFPVLVYSRGQNNNVSFMSFGSNRTVSSTFQVTPYKSAGSAFSSNPVLFFVLPSSISNTSSVIHNLFSSISLPSGSLSSQYINFYDDELSLISSVSYSASSSDIAVPYMTRFIMWRVIISSTSSTTSLNLSFTMGNSSYSDFAFDSSSGSSDLSEDILDGVTAIAQSLLALESGPYSGVSGVTVDQYGDLQHTVVNNATLENLLNAVGIATTDSNFVLRGMYNNFGSFFTYYDIDDSTSGTVVTVHGLPQYISALGSELTDGINRLQRDHDLLYQQTADIASDLSDALYADTDDSPAQSWSVAEWLRGIFNSITSFFSSFWSPAETDLKTVAESGMQEAADREIAGSADQVGDMDDLGSGFSSFGDTGNVGPGDLLDSLTGGDYSFFSSTTQQNLAYQPPQQNRDLRSSPSEPVEYVDELSNNRDYLREVLGLP